MTENKYGGHISIFSRLIQILVCMSAIVELTETELYDQKIFLLMVVFWLLTLICMHPGFRDEYVFFESKVIAGLLSLSVILSKDWLRFASNNISLGSTVHFVSVCCGLFIISREIVNYIYIYIFLKLVNHL